MKTIVDKLYEMNAAVSFPEDDQVSEGVLDKVKEKFSFFFNKVKDWIVCTFSDKGIY